jgi:hypothetical protein
MNVLYGGSEYKVRGRRQFRVGSLENNVSVNTVREVKPGLFIAIEELSDKVALISPPDCLTSANKVVKWAIAEGHGPVLPYDRILVFVYTVEQTKYNWRGYTLFETPANTKGQFFFSSVEVPLVTAPVKRYGLHFSHINFDKKYHEVTAGIPCEESMIDPAMVRDALRDVSLFRKHVKLFDYQQQCINRLTRGPKRVSISYFLEHGKSEIARKVALESGVELINLPYHGSGEPIIVAEGADAALKLRERGFDNVIG